MAEAITWWWMKAKPVKKGPATDPAAFPRPKRREGGFRFFLMTQTVHDLHSLTGKMRILVVEDDAKIASFLVNGLKQSGFAVDRCADGEAAHVLASTTAYDAAVVDVMLPKLDGLSLVQQLRKEGARIPVIILSAKASVDDRVKGLQAGGDDYLTKPFAFSELLARVQALIRRATNASEPTRLTAGDLTLDLLNREVTRGTEKIELQAARIFAAGIFVAQRGPGSDQDHDS